MANDKKFLVSTADFAFRVNGVVACTGTTNLNTSIEVSTQEQNVNAGKGNKIVYSYKYGRELTAALEAADWKLEYIAANVGSDIVEGMKDVYALAECADVVEGIVTLKHVPVGDVAIETDGMIFTVTPVGSMVDLTEKGVMSGTVKATYKYNRLTKRITIDADSTPLIGELVLDADRHSNKLGKIGSLQIVIPSYQLNGSFSINLTPDGVTSTNLDGRALAIEGDKCADGSSVYAYIDEFDTTATAISVTDVVASPAIVELSLSGTRTTTVSVIGLKGGLTAPIQLDNADVTFASEAPDKATVGEHTGVIEAIAEGETIVTATYADHTDIVRVKVVA